MKLITTVVNPVSVRSNARLSNIGIILLGLLLVLVLLSAGNRAQAAVPLASSASRGLQNTGLNAVAQGGATLSVSPASVTIDVGATTIVDIRVENVTNLYGVDLGFTFDPAAVEVVDADGNAGNGVNVASGTFLNSGSGFTLQNGADNAAGTITYVFSQLNPAPPVSGGGVVLRITFRGKALGSSPVHFSRTNLANNASQAIQNTPTDGAILVGVGRPTNTPTQTPAAGGTSTSTATSAPSQTATSTRTVPATATSTATQVASSTATQTVLPGSPQVSVQPSAATINAGERVTVEIKVQNVVNLYGVDLELTYDPAILEAINADGTLASQVQPGNFPNPASGFVVRNTVDNSAGHSQYAMTLLSPAPAANGSGTAFMVYLRGKNGGASSLLLTRTDLSAPGGIPILAGRANGQVTVVGPTATPTSTGVATSTATPQAPSPTPTAGGYPYPGPTRTPGGNNPGPNRAYLPLVLKHGSINTVPETTATPTATQTATVGQATPTATATPVASCANAVSNGGFENSTVGWVLNDAPCRPFSSTFLVHSGAASLFFGIPTFNPDRACDSWAYQTIVLPAGQSAVLHFWYWASSDEDASGFDWQEVQVRDTSGILLAAPWHVWEDGRTWRSSPNIDLSAYAGRTIRLYFNVHNDGVGAKRTFLYVDDVAVTTCPR
ncbi:MAG: hypothetical protein EXR62_11800 [Chloroflexi bacterium]|nr:hypothetical protein [Chloroflexota bacterium]